jgi:hypothetical protein
MGRNGGTGGWKTGNEIIWQVLINQKIPYSLGKDHLKFLNVTNLEI